MPCPATDSLRGGWNSRFAIAGSSPTPVPFEVEGEVPFPIEEILVDWEIVGGDRPQTIVSASIAQRKHVATLLGELKEANCDPRILEAEGFALGNLANLFDLPGTRLLADIGHRKTALCLMIDGRAVATRSLPVGGRALTEAIASDRQWTLEDAERAKCEDGIFQLGLESATSSALSVIDRIAREIVRTLQSFEPILAGSKVEAATLIGGTAKLHRLDEYLSERTGISATLLALPSEEEGAALVAGGDPVLFAPAIALALRGSARATTRMNFRQDEFAYRTDLRRFFGRDMRTSAALAAAVVVLMATGVATSITLDARRAGRLEAQVAQIYQEAFPDQPLPSNPISAMREAGVRTRDRADFLGVYGGNRSALDLLAELSRRIPSDLEVKFEEVTIDRRVIRIKVHATSFEAADRITAELADDDPFRDVKIDGEVKSSRKRPGMVFNLTIPLAVPGEGSTS